MCVSRLHLVLEDVDEGFVSVRDVEGVAHRVSLLAYEGPPLRAGDWIVAHSGFALTRVEPDEADSILTELGAGGPMLP
jgi:hydrogenase maturation factor